MKHFLFMVMFFIFLVPLNKKENIKNIKIDSFYTNSIVLKISKELNLL